MNKLFNACKNNDSTLLNEILNNMSEDQYNSMLPAIEDNFNRIEQYRPTEDYMFKTYPFLFE